MQLQQQNQHQHSTFNIQQATLSLSSLFLFSYIHSILQTHSTPPKSKPHFLYPTPTPTPTLVHSIPKPKNKMHRILGDKFQFCFSKPKNQTPLSQNDHHPCSHPHHNPKHIPHFYDLPCSSSTSKSFTTSNSELLSSDSDADTLPTAPPVPDLATLFASQRFFFSSPGRSNSIIDSNNDSKRSLESDRDDSLVAGGIPVQTYSPDPYLDFRQSMVEMVEAKELFDVKADWDGLHELLLCYFALNPSHTHKYIIAAFTDVLLTLTSAPPSHRNSDASDYCSVSSRFGGH